jgi:hypothetical protein
MNTATKITHVSPWHYKNNGIKIFTAIIFHQFLTLKIEVNRISCVISPNFTWTLSTVTNIEKLNTTCRKLPASFQRFHLRTKGSSFKNVIFGFAYL